jgi:multidrug efflux system membrane fusion protein
MTSYRFRVATWLTVAAALVLGACGKQQEQAAQREVARPVKTLVLKADVGGGTRSFPGRVRAAERVELAFQVAGKIVELPVKQGQAVQKDDLIARLDNRTFVSNVQSAQARFDEAQANFKRGDELVKKGYIARTDYDNLKARRDAALAELEKAKKALEDTVLKAPFAGVVAKRYVENFQEVQAKEAIADLQDTSAIEVVVDAPEQIVAQRGRKVKAEMVAVFDSIPDREFPLTIKEFATRADPQTQTFEYVLTMPQPKGVNILPGMTASVIARVQAFASGAEQPAFVVPAAAVFADASGVSHVWVVDRETHTVHGRKVVTGELTGTDGIRVTGGLKTGDVIAAAGVNSLREGQKVKPVDKIEF